MSFRNLFSKSSSSPNIDFPILPMNNIEEDRGTPQVSNYNTLPMDLTRMYSDNMGDIEKNKNTPQVSNYNTLPMDLTRMYSDDDDAVESTNYDVVPMQLTLPRAVSRNSVNVKNVKSPSLPRVVSTKTQVLPKSSVKIPRVSVRSPPSTFLLQEEENLKDEEAEANITAPIEENIKEIKTVDSYEKLKELGKGGFGEVWMAKLKSNNSIVALKILNIPANNIKVLKMAETEAENLKKISTPECYPFISCYYDYFYDRANSKFYIEMEYIQGKDLLEWSYDFTEPTLYVNLLYIMIDICKALRYVHRKGLIHKDIKPQNILIDVNNVPKLVDFGLACTTEECYASTVYPTVSKCCLNSKGGTPVYMAPETLEYSVNYFVSDVWGLGASIFAVATKKYPFNMGDMELGTVINTIITKNPTLLDTSNPILNDAVNVCLVKSPHARIKLEDLLAFLEENRGFFKDYLKN